MSVFNTKDREPQWALGTGSIYYMGGNVGIATVNPTSTLTVTGNARVTRDVTANTFVGSILSYSNNLSGTNVFVTSNLSVGTLSPLGTADIRGQALYVGTRVSPVSAPASSNANIVLNGHGTGPIASGSPCIYHRASVGLALSTDYQMSFEVNGTTARREAVRITDAGLVGIGVTAPGSNLHVSSSDFETAIRVENTSAGGKSYELISGGSGGSYTNGRFGVYSRTDNFTVLTMTSNTGAIAGGTGGKSVGFPHAGVWIDRTWADNPGITVCNQNVSGNISQGTFRIHGTNATFNSYPFASGADFSVNMQIDGGTYATSDRRSKINVTSITNALDIIGKLDGKRFQRINSMGEVQSHISQNSYKFGFIAQDVQNQGIDELYIYNPADDDGTNNYNTSYCLDYSSLTAVLVNAIKEQNEMIVDLRNRISKLESR